jgi:hypothetical protein
MKNTILLFAIILSLFSCSKDDEATLVLSTEKQINSFVFFKQDNPNLAQDVSGIINVQEQTITFLFPTNTTINQLKPNYSISPKSNLLLNNVILNNSSVINGSTNNNLTIQAEDGSVVNYVLKFNFSPLSISNTKFPKMCVLYQPSNTGTQPVDTLFYTYNSKNRLTNYKSRSIKYEFDYINDTIISRRRGYYTSSNSLFETYDYNYQSINPFTNIISISSPNGIGSVTNFWYLSGQIERYNISYYNVVKEEHSNTLDNFNRVITDNNWQTNAQNNRLNYIDTYTYYDTIYDPNPLIGLRFPGTTDYCYSLINHKAYAIKTQNHDNSANSPYGSGAYSYNYTVNSDNYIVKLTSGNNTTYEYIYE